MARRPSPGRVIELVESHGKQLDVIWDDGLILHTNLLFGGTWHLYRTGERWRKPSSLLRVGIMVDSFSAVCFGARNVETYREFDTHRHPGFGRSGPDLCAPSPDLRAAVEALCRYQDLDAPIAEALLDQQVACGVGNVFRSEILWACQHYPFAPVSMLARSDMERIILAAATGVARQHSSNPGGCGGSSHRACRVRQERAAVSAMRRHDRGAAHRPACPVAVLVPRVPGSSRPSGRGRRVDRAATDGPPSRSGEVLVRAAVAAPRPTRRVSQPAMAGRLSITVSQPASSWVG